MLLINPHGWLVQAAGGGTNGAPRGQTAVQFPKQGTGDARAEMLGIHNQSSYRGARPSPISGQTTDDWLMVKQQEKIICGVPKNIGRLT